MLMSSRKSISQNNLKQILEEQQYRIVGWHSAVKICHWTKESLRSSRACYKELWYPPVESHRCMQMTPYLGCNYHCLHCWRLHSGDGRVKWREVPFTKRIDDPEKIVTGCVRERRQLLIGFKGNANVDRKRFDEALQPSMMTLSLTGEPVLYPRVGDLVEEAKRQGMITFLVTNGSLPERLEEIDPLPWQLYVSVYAPDQKTYSQIARPKISKAWDRLHRTLELLPSLETRRVIRLTMIKGYNMKDALSYSKMIKKAEPDFVEVKAYEWVGASQNRLPREAMPRMKEVRAYATDISRHTGYKLSDEFKPSGVILLTA
jgi:tRNA wybutosine-synthesizing protein 1